MKAFLENFAAILGTATITLLLMSISHEYGYFWSIGSKFQTFLTTSDYLTNGVLWLPLALLFLYNWADWSRFQQQEKPKKDWKKWTSWINPMLGVLTTLNVIALFSWPLQSWVAINVIAAVVIIWAAVWENYVPKFELEEPFNSLIRRVVCFGPPVMIGMFIYGSVDAEIDLTTVSDPYTFQLKTEPNSLRIFLRNFDKGVLVRDVAEKRIEFLKWEDIVSISRHHGKETRYPICVVFGLLCGPEPALP
jgi:hypothetical protein